MSASLTPDSEQQPLGTAPLAGSESAERDYGKLFAYVLLGAFVLRLFLLTFPYQFTLDVNTFRSWGDTLYKVGPHLFYQNTWSDYPPLFMYFLWLWASLAKLVTGDSMMSIPWAKMPGCIADVLNGLLIFHLLRGRVAIRSAFHTATFYLFNPLVLFVSAIWGQVDSVITLSMLLTTLAVMKDRLVLSAISATASVFIKPQGLFLIPVALFALWHRHPLRRWPLALGSAVLTAWLILVPANLTKLIDTQHGVVGFLKALFVAPFFWFAKQMQATGDNYPYSTVNAFNIWMLPPPNEAWKPDDRILLFLTHAQWGMGLVALTLATVAWYLWRTRTQGGQQPMAPNASAFMLGSAVALTGYYMLATRMHERYIFPAIAFLALAQAFNRRLSWLYWSFSLTSFVSISYVFFYYNDQSSWVEGVKAMMNNGPMLANLKLSGMVLISLLNVWLFGELLSLLFDKTDVAQELGENPVVRVLRTISAQVRVQALTFADALIPLGIAAAFCGLALYHLGAPAEQIFDEVYHARTAMEYIRGVSPYEWTHPPLAKLIAALGILAWGGGWELDAKTFTEQQAFSWRFTSVIFGGVALVATYALARAMFGNRVIATAATVLLALDGVFFVQSRTAMTNIYEVAFILIGTVGTWQFLKRDDGRWLLLTSFGLGCALATRWSSLYAWGLTGLLLLYHAWRVRRPQWVDTPAPNVLGLWQDLKAARKAPMLQYVGLIALTMGVIPVMIYLATYIPYVLQGGGDWQIKLLGPGDDGKGWTRVIHWQKEMWGYHAHLNATHPYSSPWWSWPLMLRPTWYYFHDLKSTGFNGLAGIWAIGNAAIWWASVPALLYVGYLGWRDRLTALGATTMLGLGLWIMWGVQPRPLLYMHYMFETIPFACIAMAYIGYTFWNGAPEPAAQAPAATEAPAARPSWWERQDPVRLRRVLVACYAVLVLAWFIFYYPLLAGIPISWDFYQHHIWYGRAWI